MANFIGICKKNPLSGMENLIVGAGEMEARRMRAEAAAAVPVMCKAVGSAGQLYNLIP
jgi:hypothetical protein